MSTLDTQTPPAARLLEAAKFGKLYLRNRLAVAPMTRVTATAEGVITQQMHDYYVRFAKGGFGLVITEGLYTDQAFSQGYPDQPGLALDEQAKAWAPTVHALQQSGARVVAQIMHSGALSQGNRFTSHTVAPSAIQPKGLQMSVYYGKGGYPVPERISDEQIEEVIRGFADTAARAILVSGFDGVEVHAANGYLLDQFISAESNTRTDRWGGDQYARMSLVTKIIHAVRDAVGAEATVGVRISQGKVNDFAYKWSEGPKDAAVIFGSLKDAGVDYIHVTEFDATYPAFGGEGETLVQLASRIAPEVPLIANGTLHDLEAANLVVGQGAGVVSLGRAALANPDFPHRLATGAPLRTFDDAVLKPIATIKEQELKAEILPGRKTIRLKIP